MIRESKLPVCRECKFRTMSWAYGITTVPERFETSLPKTLATLANAGFERPRLFVDGANSLPDHLRSYQASFRMPRVRTFANWMLGLMELYFYSPKADFFVVFQDDIIACKNLKYYLETCDYPKQGYLNLYTVPENERPERGWYLARGRGQGALGLVLSNEATRKLLSSDYMVNRALDDERGWKCVDGGIVDAFRKIGWSEWCHNPSLLKHQPGPSSMGNPQFAPTRTFPGEEFDAIALISSSA